MRRVSLLLSALSVAILIYLVFAILIYNRIMGMTCVRRSGPPPVPLYQNGLVNLFGYQVRLELALMAASIAPCCWIVCSIFGAVRRRNRELLGECIECGFPLAGTRGRCPKCGNRYEVSARRRPAFPVKV